MPAFIAALLGGLLTICGSLAGRVLVSLGFGVLTFTGLNVTVNWMKDQAVAHLSGLPADILGLVAYMKVGVAISIVCSAVLARLLYQGVSVGGSISRLAMRYWTPS